MCLLGDNIKFYKYLIRPYTMNGAHSRLSHNAFSEYEFYF